jgi:hypothetical protein
VLRVAQECRAKQRHDGSFHKAKRPATVTFPQSGQCPAGFQESEDLAHIGWQIGPLVMRLNGRNDVGPAIRKRQRGYRALLDLHSPNLNVVRIRVS